MLLYYATYYFLDMTMGAFTWTATTLYKGVSSIVFKNKTREEKIDEYVIIENSDELRKEIKELRKLINSKRITLEG